MLDGDPAPLPKGGGAPKFSAHVYCDQTARWMKLVLGMEVGLGPGNFVLAEDPASPPPKGGGVPSPICGPFLLWPNCWMHQDATWYGCRPQPGRGLCVRWRPSPLPQKGAEPSNFRPVSIVAKTAGWIKMARGMEVGLGPGHIVLDGVPSSAKGA